MEVIVHILAPIGVIAIVAVFFVFYSQIWESTTREPWTYILRRNDWLSAPIIAVVVASLGVVTWQTPWWLSWLPVFLSFVVALLAHVDWSGLRAGEIHRPTAWRCAEELKQHSTTAAAWLEQRLIDEGHPYAGSDRKGQRRGLS